MDAIWASPTPQPGQMGTSPSGVSQTSWPQPSGRSRRYSSKKPPYGDYLRPEFEGVEAESFIVVDVSSGNNLAYFGEETEAESYGCRPP